VVWNRTLAARQARWQTERKSTSYAQSDAALTTMKKDPGLAFLSEVSSVPLQQALRHQHRAFAAFFARRARYPRFRSRCGRQAAHYTRRAFTLRGGVLRLARTAGPLWFTWSWPAADLAALDPAMVIICREPDGRWYVTFTVDNQAPEPLPATGRAVGVDLGVTDFAVTSEGEKIPNPGHLERRARRAGPVPAAAGPLPERVIDRWYPSSKSCSACGYLLAELSLSTRYWTCPFCGAQHDRDINAAKNILAAGRAVTACGAGIGHRGTPPVRPAVKQEPRPVTAGIPVLQGGE